ncbi:MAG TPA: CheR family methyltransferase [Anaeromyxobacteraceae bacterium]|nr:CheR family methyltransferase [Anaeromyxobacteraceae bacterium]
MTDLFAPEDLSGLAALLKERVGLNIRPEGFSVLRLALGARFDDADRPRVAPKDYLDVLRRDEKELRRLLPLLTVGKTSFFRDKAQFEALAALMPDMLSRCRAEKRPLSVWSAGCATGEESWSIAMTAAEAGAAPEDIELLATDLNPEAVAFAARGEFSVRRMSEVPRALRDRYFECTGEICRVSDPLRLILSRIVTHNLASISYPRPTSGAWDAIFCRNVIIYFDTPTAQAVLSRFLNALTPGGWLFLGYSESLFRLFDGFELAEVGGAFLYRRPAAPVPAPAVAIPPPRPPPRYTPPRVTHAPSSARRESAPSRARPHFSPQEVLAAAVQLVMAGRFVAARDRLEAYLSGDSEDLAIELTLAHLCGILKAPARALSAYQAALAHEPLCAEAHLFCGIHRYGEGDADAAAQEIARALFLDPDLAMGHYYLGRCREAQRDLRRARISYQNAIDAAVRCPEGKRQDFLGYYPDLPEGGDPFARAAERALAAL